jgi:ABC-type lipoprotein export system ATPase subunit
MNILKARALTKSYHAPSEYKVLDLLNFDVKKGSSVALMGESGTGKSTLLNCFGLIDSWDSGELEIAGQNVGQLNEEQKAKFRLDNLAFIFQFHHLIPELDVVSNVLLPHYLKGKVQKDKAVELLDSVGLSDKLHHYPWQLSGGEQQRVAIARALVTDPKILLTDEATGNLDPKRAESILEILLKLSRDRGITLISVTHDASLAARYNFQYRLKNGRLWDCLGNREVV